MHDQVVHGREGGGGRDRAVNAHNIHDACTVITINQLEGMVNQRQLQD